MTIWALDYGMAHKLPKDVEPRLMGSFGILVEFMLTLDRSVKKIFFDSSDIF